MFGYVRPEKPLLLMRDFALYKAVYCGLCKAIGRRCGQIPRVTVTYDLTFLSIVLLAFSSEEADIGEEGCILNPVKKKPVLQKHPVLNFAADLSCLLAYASARDNRADGQSLVGTAESLLLFRAGRKAARLRPDEAEIIRTRLSELNTLEKGAPAFEAADCFGNLLYDLTQRGLDLVFHHDGEEREGDGAEKADASDIDASLYRYLIGEGMRALGRWVYLLDAIDDLQEDRKKKNWNPFLCMPDAEARADAAMRLVEAEQAVDRGFALLTYPRMGALVYNIVVHGLPMTRQRVLDGLPLPKV